MSRSAVYQEQVMLNMYLTKKFAFNALTSLILTNNKRAYNNLLHCRQYRPQAKIESSIRQVSLVIRYLSPYCAQVSLHHIVASEMQETGVKRYQLSVRATLLFIVTVLWLGVHVLKERVQIVTIMSVFVRNYSSASPAHHDQQVCCLSG